MLLPLTIAMAAALLSAVSPASVKPASEAISEAKPSDQKIIFYNARMALREKNSTEALKLWLLRNMVHSKTDEVSVRDEDFKSIVWAALGDKGLCQDGFAQDTDGAGLWPLGFHNWVVRNRTSSSPISPPAPFDVFDMGRQQRFISLNDVLSTEELKATRFFRSFCVLPYWMMIRAQISPFGELREQRVAAGLLRYSLKLSRETLDKDKIEGLSVIDARIFDLNLQMAAIARREAKRASRGTYRKGREKGISKSAARQMKDDEPKHFFPKNSEEARILRESLRWPVSEWLALSGDRRLFLYDHARKANPEDPHLETLALDIMDALIERGRGKELSQWISYLSENGDRLLRQSIWSGERGESLLSLDRDTGFRERPVIALQRGVAFLQEGRMDDAMRSMAYALQHADESRAADEVAGLSRRWLSFIAAHFEVNRELLTTLRALVPRQDFSVLLEDMIWHAALGGDNKSFLLCAEQEKRRTALSRRIAKLRPLAAGKVGEFMTGMREVLDEQPYFAMRFMRRFLDRLEAEDGDVRAMHAPLLDIMIAMLDPLSSAEGGTGGHARRVDEMLKRIYAMLDGLEWLMTRYNSPQRDAAALAPSGEVFAGRVRLAPSDPLPWPFKIRSVEPPSVFTPIQLIPVEWRDEDNKLIFGWKLSE